MPSSRLRLLQPIRDALDVNISLHGGSGTPGEQFRRAAEIGVGKGNVNSDRRDAYRTTLEQQLRDQSDEYAIVEPTTPVIRAIQDVVEDRIDLLGAAARAEVSRCPSPPCAASLVSGAAALTS